jgi:hypothetical protein
MPDERHWIELGIPFGLLGALIIFWLLLCIYDHVKKARTNTYLRAQQDVGCEETLQAN